MFHVNGKPDTGSNDEPKENEQENIEQDEEENFDYDEGNFIHGLDDTLKWIQALYLFNFYHLKVQKLYFFEIYTL